MGAGHASTSIGYAVGLKEAMRRGIGEDGKVVAVIGDGALTGGVAYEALHHAGGLETPIVIVLNDNGMSISPNVGALSHYFNRFRLNPRLFHAREDVEERLTQAAARPRPPDRAARPRDQVGDQGLLGPGPAVRGARPRLHGRDRRPRRRRPALGARQALAAERPVVLHIHTVKGKGFAAAEEGGLEGMEEWHAAKPGSIVDRKPAKSTAPSPVAGAPVGGGTPPKPIPVQESDSPDLDRAREARGAAAEALAARLHLRLRQRARRRGEARQARDRDHRRDGRRHRPRQARRARSPSSTTTSGSPSRTPSSSPPGSPCRARSRSARSTRPSCSAPSTRSSTTSACRSSTSSSRWTAPGSSATTARPTTAPSTSPTSGRCRTWS